jgi:hypothetical protein
MTKYSSKGPGVYADATGWNITTCQYTSLVLLAGEDVEKTGGPPTHSSGALLHFFMYNYCTYEETAVTIVSSAPDLHASVKTGATVRFNFTEVEQCCYDYTSGWDLVTYWCAMIPLEGTLSATLTPNGPVINDRYMLETTYPGFRHKEWDNGPWVWATVDFTGTSLDGVPFVPDHGSETGQISNSKNGVIETSKLFE